MVTDDVCFEARAALLLATLEQGGAIDTSGVSAGSAALAGGKAGAKAAGGGKGGKAAGGKPGAGGENTRARYGVRAGCPVSAHIPVKAKDRKALARLSVGVVLDEINEVRRASGRIGWERA